MIDFPASPTENQMFQAPGGPRYVYSNGAWRMSDPGPPGTAQTRNRIVNPAFQIGQENGKVGPFGGNDSYTAGTPDFVKNLNDAITKHGYPAGADPKQINFPMTVLLLTILVIYVTLVYAPIAAFLVELFPTRIRYTGMSLPYHIGNGWFGGFLPATVFAIVAATGNIYSGLWYPIIIAAMSFVVALIFLPETKDRDINKI